MCTNFASAASLRRHTFQTTLHSNYVHEGVFRPDPWRHAPALRSASLPLRTCGPDLKLHARLAYAIQSCDSILRKSFVMKISQGIHHCVPQTIRLVRYGVLACFCCQFARSWRAGLTRSRPPIFRLLISRALSQSPGTWGLPARGAPPPRLVTSPFLEPGPGSGLSRPRRITLPGSHPRTCAAIAGISNMTTEPPCLRPWPIERLLCCSS